MFEIRRQFGISVTACTAVLGLVRGVEVAGKLGQGDPDPLLAYPLGVVFPALLVLLLLRLPAAKSREGILMRVGTVLHLLLIMALPSAALYLALGFPVVFLVVELFETRMPPRWRDPLVRIAVR